VKLAIYAESGAHWTNARLQRSAYLRRRGLAVVVWCLLLCGCAAWPNLAYEFTGCYREGGEWIVTWKTFGVERHVRTSDYGSAMILDAVLWARGRTTSR